MDIPRQREQNKRNGSPLALPAFGLKKKLLFALTTLVLALIVTLLIIVEGRYRTSIVVQVEKRGKTIAKQLANSSSNALLTYNWIALKQDADNVSRDPDVLYAIILQRDGTVAAFSGHPELQEEILTDPVSRKAAATTGTLIQQVPRGAVKSIDYYGVSDDYYDVSEAVFVPNNPDKWDTVRVALSLREMYAEIRKTRLWILLVGGIGGVLSLTAVA